MTEINVTTYRQLLEAQAQELQELNEATQSDTAPVELDKAAVGRLSRMDALQQQAMAEETRRRRLREIALIEAALDRIEEGEYGFCLTCGEAIPIQTSAGPRRSLLCGSCKAVVNVERLCHLVCPQRQFHSFWHVDDGLVRQGRHSFFHISSPISGLTLISATAVSGRFILQQPCAVLC